MSTITIIEISKIIGHVNPKTELTSSNWMDYINIFPVVVFFKCLHTSPTIF
jgi:hypothetical protein